MRPPFEVPQFYNSAVRVWTALGVNGTYIRKYCSIVSLSLQCRMPPCMSLRYILSLNLHGTGGGGPHLLGYCRVAGSFPTLAAPPDCDRGAVGKEWTNKEKNPHNEFNYLPLNGYALYSTYPSSYSFSNYEWQIIVSQNLNLSILVAITLKKRKNIHCIHQFIYHHDLPCADTNSLL